MSGTSRHKAEGLGLAQIEATWYMDTNVLWCSQRRGLN